MDILDMSYERTFMDNAREEYYSKMLDSLINHNDCHDTPFSSKNLQEAVSRVTAETEEEEKYSKRNVNNVTTYT